MTPLRHDARALLDRYRAGQSLGEAERAHLLDAIRTRVAQGAGGPSKGSDPLGTGAHPALSKVAGVATKVFLGLALASGAAGTAWWASSRNVAPSATATTPRVIPSTSSTTEPAAMSASPMVTAVAVDTVPPAPAPPAPRARVVGHPKPSPLPVATAVENTLPSPSSSSIVVGESSPEPASLAAAPQTMATSRTAPAEHALDPVDLEVGLVGLAYTRLRDGDPNGALAALEEHERRFPDGKLAESRRVTRVLALCQAGRVAQARVERDDFLARYPHSPFTHRVRSACIDAASPTDSR